MIGECGLTPATKALWEKRISQPFNEENPACGIIRLSEYKKDIEAAQKRLQHFRELKNGI